LLLPKKPERLVACEKRRRQAKIPLWSQGIVRLLNGGDGFCPVCKKYIQSGLKANPRELALFDKPGCVFYLAPPVHTGPRDIQQDGSGRSVTTFLSLKFAGLPVRTGQGR